MKSWTLLPRPREGLGPPKSWWEVRAGRVVVSERGQTTRTRNYKAHTENDGRFLSLVKVAAKAISPPLSLTQLGKTPPYR